MSLKYSNFILSNAKHVIKKEANGGLFILLHLKDISKETCIAQLEYTPLRRL